MEMRIWRLNMKKHIGIALVMVLATALSGCYFFPERDNENDPYNGMVVFLGAKKISNGQAASIAWTGTEYGVVWSNAPHIYFGRRSSNGTKIGTDIQIDHGGSAGTANPAIAWNGVDKEYGVAWKDYRDVDYEIYFTRISENGVEQGTDDVRITSASGTSDEPSLVWTGTEYGLAWFDLRSGATGIYFTRISSAGAEINDDVQIETGDYSPQSPVLVWAGSEYGLAWCDMDAFYNYNVFFARISSAGVKQGGTVDITSNASITAAIVSQNPSLVWTGSEYALAWEDDRDGDPEIFFNRLTSAGVKAGDDIQITGNSVENTNPSLVWTGSCYAVAEMDYEFYSNVQVFFMRFDQYGSRIGENICLSDKVHEAFYPHLIWTGSNYTAVWRYGEGSPQEIYFRFSE